MTSPLLLGAAICAAAAISLAGCGKNPSGTTQSATGAATQRAVLPPTKTGTPPQSGAPVHTVATPAVQAIFDNDVARLRALLDAGTNPNEQDANWYSLLHHAARAGRLEAVQLLVERGADVNIRARLNVTPLLWAARSNELEIVKFLVENGADVNARGGVDNQFTAMSFAAQVNYVDIVDYLATVGGEM